MGKSPEEKAARKAAKAEAAGSPDKEIKKLTKEEKAAKKAKKAAKADAAPIRESPRIAAQQAAAEEAAVPDMALEEEVDDGFKIKKYAPPAEPEDETLQCRDCGGDFIFTVGEQEFFKSKGFDNKKTRCADCTAAKKARFGEGGGGKGGGKGKGGGGRGGGGRGGGSGTCYNCGEEGHMSFACEKPRSGGGKGKGGGGVFYAFQKGECSRGDSCRFSHSS
jgi:cleavage and polyadenylation specificity factor subunit 4